MNCQVAASEGGRPNCFAKRGSPRYEVRHSLGHSLIAPERMKKILILLAGMLPALAHAQTNSPAPASPQKFSPEVHSDRTVTFRARAAGATNISVWGEWRGGGTPVPMTKDEHGVWSVTVGPLEPDRYAYGFAVDGFRTVDPANSDLKPMHLSGASALDVPGDKPALYDFQDVPHGTVRLHDYQSKSLGRLRHLRIYTPPGYETSRTKQPVLYLLHGSGDNQATWTEFGHAQYIMDNLLAQHRIKPMLVIMTDGHAVEAQQGGGNLAAYERDLLEDVIPFVEKNYRVKADCDHRAIIGLSMGGGQSLTIGLTHPELFAWVGGMSSAANTNAALAVVAKAPPAANKKLKLLWFACGKSDRLLRNNAQLDEALTQIGIKHTFVQTEGAHEWPVWRRNLADFAPLIFSEK
jgi:enterochelin esterase-like enzyme